jgi:hypothetical protein
VKEVVTPYRPVLRTLVSPVSDISEIIDDLKSHLFGGGFFNRQTAERLQYFENDLEMKIDFKRWL